MDILPPFDFKDVVDVAKDLFDRKSQSPSAESFSLQEKSAKLRCNDNFKVNLGRCCWPLGSLALLLRNIML